MDDLTYALIQLVHNSAAAAVVGLPAAALWLCRRGAVPRPLARWLLIAWAVQIASGAGFAAASYTLKGALPEIGGVALAALLVKLSCAALGIGAAGLTLRRARRAEPRPALWGVQLGAAVVAFGAAAFLRWYL